LLFRHSRQRCRRLNNSSAGKRTGRYNDVDDRSESDGYKFLVLVIGGSPFSSIARSYRIRDPSPS
jgi:hypothetical protein